MCGVVEGEYPWLLLGDGDPKGEAKNTNKILFSPHFYFGNYTYLSVNMCEYSHHFLLGCLLVARLSYNVDPEFLSAWSLFLVIHLLSGKKRVLIIVINVIVIFLL